MVKPMESSVTCARLLARRQFLGAALLAPLVPPARVTTGAASRLVPAGSGWARNQVNAVIFRRHPLASHGGLQYIAYYDEAGRVVLGRRELGTDEWRLETTALTGDVRDAHNAICIAVDGTGVLHLAWNHHGSALQYCRTSGAGSLVLSNPMPMTGEDESRVTYPEFYNLPGGHLLCLYRDGRSGDGRLIINRYDAQAKRWSRVQSRLLDGEGQRSAYWQAVVSGDGAIHLSWVWRETPDVRTNHDLAYAVSRDGGVTWTRSTGEPYVLPITAASAEYAARIPQGSELINQTSMCVDAAGRPVLAGYWRPAGSPAPQYLIVRHDGSSWQTSQVTRRSQDFSLGGHGTQRIPISRPLILSSGGSGRADLYLVYRDEERGSRVTLAHSTGVSGSRWSFHDLTDFPVDFWEPAHDAVLWGQSGVLHLFAQRVGQGAHESLEPMPPQPVYVLEHDPR